MKKNSKIISFITVTISLISIMASFSLIDYDKIFTIDWDILGWVLLSVSIFVLICAIVSVLLMMQRHRILRVYLSYPYSHKEEMDKVRHALVGENVITSDNIRPGTSMEELNKIIKHSHICFIVVGKAPTTMQKAEARIMRTTGKDTYVISIDKDGRVPNFVRNEVPLYTKDEDFEKKVEDILLNYK